MADKTTVDNGTLTDYDVLTDEVTDATLGTGKKQLVGIVDGTIDSTNKLIVDSSGRARVDASGVAVPVTDNSGSLTVDAPVGTPVFVRTSDGAAAIDPRMVLDSAGTNIAAVANTADGDIARLGLVVDARGKLWNGASWDRIRGDTTNGLDVDVTRLPALVAGAANIGSVNLASPTTGGHSTHHLVSAATTNATNIKASAGQVYGWYIYNSATGARKVAFHNTSGTPTAGASIFFAIVIPAGGAANVFDPQGIAFSTGIGITMVTDLTDAGATAVAVNDLISNIFYT